ncbi:transporter substrate-binding domain-containing protein [Acidisphaera sp. S103]|uniref:transporter substrate-binding domain-containing protein n=1 Tax=Acidisphaera sp. S103 TaxID=1747223 RepID=UPI00131DA0D0|nr:transporter substrate-binding domain-containing protein [Acidisphaera sp. S103]
MTISRRLAFGAAALPLALAATVEDARAQSAPGGDTLDTIIKRGSLIVGTSLGTPPYGLTNSNMEPDGYDVGTAKLIAKELGVKVQIVDIVAANRIPSLTSGKVDIVISSFSITSERAKAIAFSNCVFVDQQVALAPKSLGLTGNADLKGKRIGVTRSTTNDIAVTRHAPEGTDIQRYDDDASTSQALLAGQVQAIVTSAALGVAIRDRNPALALETKYVVSQAPMAIGLRRGDADLLHWVNTALFMLWTNQEIQPLQQKWMGTVNAELPRYS